MKLTDNSFLQLICLIYDLKRIVNNKWWRWVICWFGGNAGIVVSYRLDRFFYLLLGPPWALLRIIFYPFFLILRLLSAKHEIHYAAEIGKGLCILHPNLGILISGNAIIGDNITLSGGNAIGFRRKAEKGKLIIGNNVNLGINSVVLGPLIIGDNVEIGACSLVLNNIESNNIVVGIPAKILRRK